MNAPHEADGDRVVAYGRWVVRWRWPILILTLLAAFAAGSGARFLGFDTGYRVFFSEDNPQLKAFDELENVYNKNDNVLFVLAPKSGDVFTPEMLSRVVDLTERSWRIPYARRVDSITNFQHTRADGDDLVVQDLVSTPEALSAGELAEIREIALSRPFLVNRVVSERGHVTGVNVTVEFPGVNPRETTEIVAHVRNVADEVRAEHPDVNVYLSGVVMLNNAFAEGGETDMKTLVPIMFAVILITSAFLLRTVSGVLGTLAVIVLSTTTAMGIAGFLGMKITPPSSVAPTMIMTLAVADSIHILVTMLGARRSGLSKNDSLVEAMRVNMRPVFLTSLTTAIGFASLNFSDAPPFRDLGNIAAIGVSAAFVYSVLFLPALIAILPMSARFASQSNWGMDRLGGFVIRRSRPLLWGSVASVLMLAAFIPRNELNDQFIEYFDERVQFRRDADFTMENLSGIYGVEYSLGTGEAGGISDPEYLATLDAFESWFREQPGVMQVQSYGHVMRRVNKSMHGDDPAYFRQPEERNLAAQYLLLFEMSLPFGLDLNDQLDVDKSSTRFTVTLENLSSNEMRALAEAGEAWLRDNAPESMFAYGTGPAIMFSYISERNIRTMIGGTIVALVLISMTLIFAFRSLRYGLLSLVPNLVPAAIAFGIWGIFAWEAGIALSSVVAMSLGIVADDTVRFLSKYLRARRERELGAEDAVRYAFTSVGKALVVTSAILVAGFLVMTRSSFSLNAVMGQFTALTIAAALAADFFLFPAILLRLDRAPARGARMALRRAGAAAGFGALVALVPLGVSEAVVDPAASPEANGLAIAMEADRRDSGWKDFEADLTMTLRNRHGQESVRTLRTRSIEVDGDGDKTLIIFDDPRDVKGTALLSFAHKSGEDDQWLFLPALNRVKRIASNNKSGPFMGSEFAYEDVSSQEVEEYTYRFVGESDLEGDAVFVVERYPVDARSGYTKEVVYVDQGEYRTRKVEYYDRKDELLKTLVFGGYELHLETYWRAREMEMENRQTGKSTLLVWENYRFGTGLDDSDFTTASLKRVR